MRIFTVGHGARTLDELLATLQAGGVTQVVDVRRYPGSRRHPHFSRENLEHELPRARIRYTWLEALGGRRPARKEGSPHPSWQVAGFRGYAEYMDSELFQDALQHLVELAARFPTAFMCSETHWSQCHRRLISDRLWAQGHEVIHLITPTRQQPHTPPPFMRTEAGRVFYDLPVDEKGQVSLLPHPHHRG